MHDKTASSSERKHTQTEEGNGTSEPQKKETSADEARRPATQRAEELVDQLGEQIGHCVSALGHNILRWAARAREEAEDIWAEAQTIRQRNQKG